MDKNEDENNNSTNNSTKIHKVYELTEEIFETWEVNI